MLVRPTWVPPPGSKSCPSTIGDSRSMRITQPNGPTMKGVLAYRLTYFGGATLLHHRPHLFLNLRQIYIGHLRCRYAISHTGIRSRIRPDTRPIRFLRSFHRHYLVCQDSPMINTVSAINRHRGLLVTRCTIGNSHWSADWGSNSRPSLENTSAYSRRAVQDAKRPTPSA